MLPRKAARIGYALWALVPFLLVVTIVTGYYAGSLYLLPMMVMLLCVPAGGYLIVNSR